MRVVLAFLAVMALLISPVAAGAAQARCVLGGSPAMSGMDMSAMPGPAHASAQKTSTGPCCDHSGQHKMRDKSCALACATSCATTAALPVNLNGATFAFTDAPMSLPRRVSAVSHQPFGLERPPKSMA
jgi:hypothetical protein